MKIKKVESKTAFNPITVSITIETEEELIAIREMTTANIVMPAALDRYRGISKNTRHVISFLDMLENEFNE